MHLECRRGGYKEIVEVAMLFQETCAEFGEHVTGH